MIQEIHGVAQFPPEENSSEKLQNSLALLSKALDIIKDKPAYDEAQRIASEENVGRIMSGSTEKTTTFVNEDSFRLKFLRAEQFHPEQAAERMVKHLDLLHRYLGPEGLQRPINISDLDEKSLTIIKAGSFQLLPSRDRSGRRIAVRIGPLGLDFIKNEKSVSLLWHVQLKSFFLHSKILKFAYFLKSFLNDIPFLMNRR